MFNNPGKYGNMITYLTVVMSYLEDYYKQQSSKLNVQSALSQTVDLKFMIKYLEIYQDWLIYSTNPLDLVQERRIRKMLRSPYIYPIVPTELRG